MQKPTYSSYTFERVSVFTGNTSADADEMLNEIEMSIPRQRL